MSETVQNKNIFLQRILSPFNPKLQDTKLKKFTPLNIINKKPLLIKGKSCQNYNINFANKSNFYNINNSKKNIQINNISNNNIYHFNLKYSLNKNNHKKLLKKIIPRGITKYHHGNNYLHFKQNSFFINKNLQVQKLNKTQNNFNIITTDENKNSFCSTKFENVRENKSCLMFCRTENKNSYFVEQNSIKNWKKNVVQDNVEKISIPCINCGNLIQMNEMEKHSLQCSKVTIDMLKVDLTNKKISSIDYKLKKLKDYINYLGNNNNDNNQFLEKDKYLIMIIREYIEKALKINQANTSNRKELKNISKNFAMLTIKYNKSLNYLILMDRAKLLIEEKLKIFKESYKNDRTRETNSSNNQYSSEFENSIINKQKELEKINKEMKFEQIKVKNLRKSAGPENKNKILKLTIKRNLIEKNYLNHSLTEKNIKGLQDDTSNDNDVNKTNCNDLSLFNSPKPNLEIELVNTRSPMISVRTPKNKLELSPDNDSTDNSCNNSCKSCRNTNRKLFIKKVVKIKFEKLHNSHKGQKISPNMIWKEAKKKNINGKDWGKFILNELNQPKKYVKLRKESKIKSLDHSMSIINEE